MFSVNERRMYPDRLSLSKLIFVKSDDFVCDAKKTNRIFVQAVGLSRVRATSFAEISSRVRKWKRSAGHRGAAR